jgi:hypothetical protein
MRSRSETHEQLISLQRVCLDGRTLEFGQAFLSLVAHDGAPSWSCTLRGASAARLSHLAGEIYLQALTLDGRSIEGRVTGPSTALPASEAPAVVELAGLGTLLVEGRGL